MEQNGVTLNRYGQTNGQTIFEEGGRVLSLPVWSGVADEVTESNTRKARQLRSSATFCSSAQAVDTEGVVR
jgi:hypothetical protein